MTLPEPTRTLWKQHHEAIDRIATAPGGESRTMLGGGSVLAAQWRPRQGEARMQAMTRGKRRAARGIEIVTEWDPDERKWLEEFLGAIKARHAETVKDVVIYGSKARGDWNKDSDIDILLILADEHEDERESVENLAYDLSVTADALPLVTTKTEGEWKQLGEAGAAFHRSVERDGVSVL